MSKPEADGWLTPWLERQRPAAERGVYCNRTLNLRGIRAIGYDMDYTLIHYHEEEWERRAFEYIREKLLELDWPVDDVLFDPSSTIRGLIIDKQLGNLVKANRFGYVKQAMHGTRMLTYDEQREAYSRSVVDLAEPRWVFLNTLFSLSEACMYGQLVDRLDRREIPEVLGYGELYDRTKAALDEAHMEGRLKAEIVAAPERFVALDREAPLALLEQKRADKKLLLITNSEWAFSDAMMSYAYDSLLPDGMAWRDLFDLVIVASRKPAFFVQSLPIFKIVDAASGYLEPCISGLEAGHKLYWGGDAAKVERHFGFDGNDFLYVGDHIYGDVHVSKSIRRWRTALILRELEDEISAIRRFEASQAELTRLMAAKEQLEFRQSALRASALREADPSCASGEWGFPAEHRGERDRLLAELKYQLGELDQRIAPLAIAYGELYNRRWGLLLQTGNDKSHLARQIERHADIYTSRVSNFRYATPVVYLRSRRGLLPHEQ
ncbi:MAG: HAD-IG family 5'-nucleotidase [Myxococcales bacterium]|nr:HAD-IG family 5'-nucleotidase [Myxococcales bacterium]